MAIQIRRGQSADYDGTRLLSGELALCEDTEEVFVGANGDGVKVNKRLKEYTQKLNSVSITSNGWVAISLNKPANFVFCLIKTWSGYNHGAITVTSDGTYIMGTPSTTISSVTIAMYAFE